jgi:translation initiation factor IF-1
MNKSQDKELIEIDGVVTEVLPNKMCRVKLENGHIILAYLRGSFAEKRVKMFVDDKVKVELSIYDLNRGRIVFKYKAPSDQRTFSPNKNKRYKKH